MPRCSGPLSSNRSGAKNSSRPAPSSQASVAPETAVPSSNKANSLNGRAERSASLPKAQAPSARPPMNAASTSAVAVALLPNSQASCRRNTASRISAAAPEQTNSR